jgi:3-deoxy-D-manno-octulosonic-acid transferase
MENFTPLVDLLLRNQGAVQVRGFQDLTQIMDQLLHDPAATMKLASNGQAALQVHAGATRRTVELLIGANEQ